MGCLLSCLACEAASCACRGVCACCGKVLPMSAVGGRIMYAVLFFIASFVSWIFRGFAKNMLDWIPQLKTCEDDNDLCFGALSVYRISFCLAAFHLLLALITIGVSKTSDCRARVQDGWWGVKIIVLIAGCVGSFWIPNIFFEYYGWVAFCASALFVLIQLVFLVDFAHSWAENWIGKMEDEVEDNKWWYILLTSTFFLYVGALVFVILSYAYFGHDSVHCGKNVTSITIGVALCVLLSFLSIHPKVQEHSPKSGLLQSAFISAYATYLIWSANMSDDTSCNPWHSATGASNVSILVGVIFTIVAVLYAAFSAAGNIGGVEHEKLVSPTNSSKDEEKDDKDEKDDKGEGEPVTYSYSKFHLVFAVGAMYIAMLMTDWSTVDKPANDNPQVDSGMAAFWVKTATSWLSCVIYMWTLLGPVAFPDRDWSPQSHV